MGGRLYHYLGPGWLAALYDRQYFCLCPNNPFGLFYRQLCADRRPFQAAAVLSQRLRIWRSQPELAALGYFAVFSGGDHRNFKPDHHYVHGNYLGIDLTGGEPVALLSTQLTLRNYCVTQLLSI